MAATPLDLHTDIAMPLADGVKSLNLLAAASTSPMGGSISTTRRVLDLLDSYPKAVVVHAGARDHYQLSLALHEASLLNALVTDMYWPADRRWFSAFVQPVLPKSWLAARYCQRLDSRKVRISGRAWAASAVMHMIPHLKLNRYKDFALSRRARQLALQDDGAVFATNYYATPAFEVGSERPRYRFLLQLQAHPGTLRRILLEEAARTPLARKSLEREYELCLPDAEYQQLCSEPSLANGVVATSSFAAQTLAENGVPADRIHVIPYGVDANTFVERTHLPTAQQPFKIVFAGSLIQRKGISYLLEAVRLLKSRRVRLTLCTRGFIDEDLLASYADLDFEIKLGLSGRELACELLSSDVFVFPSLAEGFAHVILEAMSCGLPVIATPNTCAPDVLVDGSHGFIVPIRDAEAIAEKLTWAIENRADLAGMGEAAATQARLFTWERFRKSIRDTYREMVASVP